MPSVMWNDEYERLQAKAVWLTANGHKVRGWLVRLGMTELRDLVRGRIWSGQ